ncbi:Unknown protein sequence [Pseudomonas amygdali pv. lachrymans]|nr:Unknown protein sequence [Pseudomonas amygdali pv. lachrymans]
MQKSLASTHSLTVIPFEACTRNRPRSFVCQVRFSMSLPPWMISQAQGWRIESAFIGIAPPHRTRG